PPRPPRSPLFPYTTLFRSRRQRGRLRLRLVERPGGESNVSPRRIGLSCLHNLHAASFVASRISITRFIARVQTSWIVAINARSTLTGHVRIGPLGSPA